MDSSIYLKSAAMFLAVMLPIVALLFWRRRLGALNTAPWLVAYGALVLLGEHAGWTLWYTLGSDMPDPVFWSGHARVHAFMAAIYAVIGLTLFVVMAGTMLRKGSRLAWSAVLFALIVGGSVEVIVNGPTGLLFQHTTPPNATPGANMLFAYQFAWAAALLISWRPVLRPGRSVGGAVPT
jgi:hypothetical protein